MKLLLDDVSVPLTSRAFSYGDGFFETMLFQDGRCALLSHHMARACNTANALAMKLSKEDARDLIKAVSDRLRATGGSTIVKLFFVREEGGRGYRSSIDAETLVYMSVSPYSASLSSDQMSQGVHLRVCDTRLSQQSRLAGLKHLNRLENVIARNEWRDEAIFEGLLLDQHGLIIEATQNNVFFFIGDRWLTPDLTHCGVAGVMRHWLLENSNCLKIESHVTTLSMDDLKKAKSCFICNSVLGVVPVQSILLSEGELNFEMEPSVELSNQVISELF